MTIAVPEHIPNTLESQMNYARAVSSASLLPQAYRNKPADIMLAVGLGQSMGLSPAESLYRIDVIQGKPTASAELIAANVRNAGHRLRVVGDDTSCTATIIRSDDPEFEFKVIRDQAWAKAMGLATKDNYKKQPGTMLQWRAITAVARLACPEALYGVAYTADEMSDLPSTQHTSGLGAALGTTLTVEHVTDEMSDPGEEMTQRTRGRMFALFTEHGITDRDEQIRGIVHIIGRPIESRSEITDAEGRAVIGKLEERARPTPADPDADYLEAVAKDAG